MRKFRPNILTIAGFDPSSGAGLTADLKTIEHLKCYGLSVQTANTIQTATDFLECHWVNQELILLQLKTILINFKINIVKFGIVEDWSFLLNSISLIKKYDKNIRIIVDPVLNSSTKFSFHVSNGMILDNVLEHVYLITPNYKEIKELYSNKSIEETIQYISKKTNLLLKGGHRIDKKGQDVLFCKGGKRFVINPKKLRYTEKHGSGCVLSSAIACYLGLGFSLLQSCFKAKRYVEKFLSSNSTLLGYHR